MNTVSRNPLGRSAAEIKKGDISVTTLSESDVVRLLDPAELLNALQTGFAQLARGEICTPNRPEITVPDHGFLLAMPCWRPGSCITVKMMCVFEKNLELGLPNHLALINMFDGETGSPVCIMDGTYITGIRTAASAILSVRALASSEASVATIVGAGVQAREHLRLLPLVRDVDEIQICSLYHDDAEQLAEQHPKAHAAADLETAVRRSDIVCLATHAYEPVIDASWIRPGTHVSSVGYAPPSGELPDALARAHKLYVEDAVAFQTPPAGCGELQDLDPAQGICLGDVFTGTAPGRQSASEITVYKAMGISMEDLVAADLVYHRAMAEKAGHSILM